MKTVFITGASSGIGKETAKLFQLKGWNVIAAMRNPAMETELNKMENIKVLQCDVTDISGIKNAIEEGIRFFGTIDVLVNNAGHYIAGPFEAATDEQIRRQIDTNLLGLIYVTKEIIPHFRKQRSGIIINNSSIAGNISIPLQTLYHASKWGVEGFSESLQYELGQFNIKIKIIQPGVIKTDLWEKNITIIKDENLKEYDSYCKRVISNIMKNANAGSSPEKTAQTIYKAATDNSSKLRYPTGNSREMVLFRKILPVSLFRTLVKMVMEK